jgi:hypothetical protein
LYYDLKDLKYEFIFTCDSKGGEREMLPHKTIRMKIKVTIEAGLVVGR